jgi:leucine-zipper-like transcriptional regulator 1
MWYIRSTSTGGSWALVTTAAPWPARNGHTSVVYNNKIWVIGGNSASGMINDVWNSYDGQSWSSVDISVGFYPRKDHTSVVYNNKMWVIGGNAEGTQMNDVW